MSRTKNQQIADDLKALGNKLYKDKKFAEAIEAYDKAIEKEPNDLTYHNNRCAVLVEMGPYNYEQVLQTCLDLINRREQINAAMPGGASAEKVAKVYARMGSVRERQSKFDDALDFYEKSIVEDDTKQTRQLLQDCLRHKEKWEKDRFLDPAKAREHRNRGNALFKERKWAEAKVEYDEAVRRNPLNAQLFSHRAAALTKLCAHQIALQDLDQCLRLDPTFVKAYSRKGTILFYLREYSKALQMYEKGLKIAPNDECCTKGREHVLSRMSTSESETMHEGPLREALDNPEMQRILRDPAVQSLLRELQESPVSLLEAARREPILEMALPKVLAAGLLRTG